MVMQVLVLAERLGTRGPRRGDVVEEDEMTPILMGGMFGGALGCVESALLLAVGFA